MRCRALGLRVSSAAFAVAAGLASEVSAAPADDAYLVMLGNSMQGCGIDFAALSDAVGVPVESKVSGGVMSAHKFAMLWQATHSAVKPTMALIVFRRNNITRPTLRVTEKYGVKLRALLTDPELKATVERLAYPEATGGATPATFAGAVEHSFVPEMIRVSREAGVQLVLVRCKSRSYAQNPTHETDDARRYTEEFTAYLQTHNVHFLDYVDVPDIGLDCFANGDHLNEEGRAVWTRLMAEDLNALLAGQRAPRERTDIKSTGTR